MRARAPLFGLLAAVLIVLAFWFLLYSPAGDRLEEVREQTATLETQRASLESEIAQLREIEANQVQIRAALARLEEYIPSGTAQSTAVRQFQLAADASGVEIESVGFGAPELVEGAPPTGAPDTALARIPLTMTIGGGYFQVVDFLRRVEVDTTRAVLMGNLAVVEGEDSFPTLSSTWTGELFSIVPAPVTPAETPATIPDEGADDATDTEDIEDTEEETP
jgi:Tfp pilus assembly protein PilO